jgi:NAD(P)-dependent dehydrogenase (short-subunit alcohol dehydrogenase family)
MLIRFDGKHVIVAGAARGIGRPSRAPRRDGAEVLACDRLVDRIELGERIRALAVDVTDPASIDKVVAAAGGRVDVLVYVAGGRARPVAEAAGAGDAGRIRRDRRRQPEGLLPVSPAPWCRA